jgi:hypothetical protein
MNQIPTGGKKNAKIFNFFPGDICRKENKHYFCNAFREWHTPESKKKKKGVVVQLV